MKKFQEWLKDKYEIKGECFSCKSFTSLNDSRLCIDCQRIVNSDL